MGSIPPVFQCVFGGCWSSWKHGVAFDAIWSHKSVGFKPIMKLSFGHQNKKLGSIPSCFLYCVLEPLGVRGTLHRWSMWSLWVCYDLEYRRKMVPPGPADDVGYPHGGQTTMQDSPTRVCLESLFGLLVSSIS